MGRFFELGRPSATDLNSGPVAGRVTALLSVIVPAASVCGPPLDAVRVHAGGKSGPGVPHCPMQMGSDTVQTRQLIRQHDDMLWAMAWEAPCSDACESVPGSDPCHVGGVSSQCFCGYRLS